MIKGEDAQLAAIAGFLKAKGLATLLLKRDWAGFVKGYNGPSYWQNRYDVKLADENCANRIALPGLCLRNIDGIIGPRTRAATKNFRIAAGLPTSAELEGPAYQCLWRRARS